MTTSTRTVAEHAPALNPLRGACVWPRAHDSRQRPRRGWTGHAASGAPQLRCRLGGGGQGVGGRRFGAHGLGVYTRAFWCKTRRACSHPPGLRRNSAQRENKTGVEVPAPWLFSTLCNPCAPPLCIPCRSPPQRMGSQLLNLVRDRRMDRMPQSCAVSYHFYSCGPNRSPVSGALFRVFASPACRSGVISSASRPAEAWGAPAASPRRAAAASPTAARAAAKRATMPMARLSTCRCTCASGSGTVTAERTVQYSSTRVLVCALQKAQLMPFSFFVWFGKKKRPPPWLPGSGSLSHPKGSTVPGAQRCTRASLPAPTFTWRGS